MRGVAWILSGALLLAAGTALAVVPAFPDWRTEQTREVVRWRERLPDTATTTDGTWYIVVSAPDLLRKDSLVWLDVLANPILSAAMWPVEKTASLLSRYTLSSIEGAALYAEREEIIARGVQLVTLDSAGTMAYPTIVMDGGTGSRLGAAFLRRGVFGGQGSLRLGGALMLSRDWYASTQLAGPPLTPFSLTPRLTVSAARSGEQAIFVPGAVGLGSGLSPQIVWESRRNLEMGLSIPVGSWGGFEPTLRFAQREVRDPVRRIMARDSLPASPWLARDDRMILGGEETSTLAGLLWGRGDVNFEGTPSEGGTQGVAVLRSWNRGGGGDAVILHLDATRYLLLGSEKYGYRKGDLEAYTNLSPKAIVSLLDPATLRKRLTQRRILALKVSARRLWEVDPEADPASYFHFPSMGGEAPARAYGGRRLMDQAVIGGTAEYRWPIWKFIDGSMFVELAWAGEHWWYPNATGLAPGAGLGLRVRTPSMFLFRGQFAYGLEGARAIVTVSPEF